MDRFELCRALRSAGVPEAYYEIQDCPHGPHLSDRYFLEERGGLWAVGVHERGTRLVWERFTDEDQACRWLHDRLTGEEPRLEPPTPEEMDRILHGGEGIQRRTREALDRALAEARGRPPQEPRPDDGRTPPPPAG